jgi:hypothetical protein
MQQTFGSLFFFKHAVRFQAISAGSHNLRVINPQILARQVHFYYYYTTVMDCAGYTWLHQLCHSLYQHVGAPHRYMSQGMLSPLTTMCTRHFKTTQWWIRKHDVIMVSPPQNSYSSKWLFSFPELGPSPLFNVYSWAYYHHSLQGQSPSW